MNKVYINLISKVAANVRSEGCICKVSATAVGSKHDQLAIVLTSSDLMR